MRLFNEILRPLARLTLLAFIVMPYQAFAGEEPWFISPSESITIVHPAPGIDYLTDLHRDSASIYDTAPGLHWYSAQNAQGQITAQGFLFDPIPRLTVPALPLPSDYPSTRTSTSTRDK